MSIVHGRVAGLYHRRPALLSFVELMAARGAYRMNILAQASFCFRGVRHVVGAEPIGIVLARVALLGGSLRQSGGYGNDPEQCFDG